MRAYSVDLSKKIVDAIRHGRPKIEVARIFGVGISSVKRYMKMAEEEGSLDPKKAPGKKRKLDESGMENVPLAQCRTEVGVVSPDTLTDGVPKVPEALRVPFWHFWHSLTLEIPKVALPARVLSRG